MEFLWFRQYLQIQASGGGSAGYGCRESAGSEGEVLGERVTAGCIDEWGVESPLRGQRTAQG